MEHRLSFAATFEYSQLFSSTLDLVINNDNNENIFCQLFQSMGCILVNAAKSNENTKNKIQSSLKKLIFSSLFSIYNAQKVENQFLCNSQLRKSMESMKKIKVNIQQKQDPKKQNGLFKYFKTKPLSSFNSLPNDVLSKSMSFIDAMDLAKIERTSHKFLQCARKPTAITHLTQEFFDKIDDYKLSQNVNIFSDLTQRLTTDIMMRYSLLKNIHIDKHVLIHLNNTLKRNTERYRYQYERFYTFFLSWLHLDECSLKSLISIISDNKINDDYFFVSNYSMNVLRGLKYIENLKSLHVYSEHYINAMYNNHLIWKNMIDIKKSIKSIKEINVSLIGNVPDLQTGFVLFAMFCHENIEELTIDYRGSDGSRKVIIPYNIDNYKNIIPTLGKLRCIKIDSMHDFHDNIDDIANDVVLKDGKAFFEALISKIKYNTLQRLEINYWYNTWCSMNIELFTELISNNYKTLKYIKFYQNDEFNKYQIFDIESWKPVIVFYKIIQNKSKNKVIEYWLNNTLKTFEFYMLMESLEYTEMDDEEYMDIILEQLEKRKNKLIDLKLMITELIKYCKENKIECIIKVNCKNQVYDDIDPFPIYAQFFMNADVKNNEVLDFNSFHKTQTLITKYLL